MAAFKGTLVEDGAGFAVSTPKVETAAADPVVKCVVCAVTALPARSVTPEIVNAICVPAGSGACGVITTTVDPFTVSGSIGPLNTMPTFALSGTAARPSAGLTVVTVGAEVAEVVP